MEYQVIQLDTAIARNDELVELNKEYTNFMIVHTDVAVEYRINSLSADKIKAEYIPGFDDDEGVFRKLYLTHPAGTGTIYLFCFR